MKKLLLSSCLVLSLASQGHAASISAQANANIISAITITESSQLDLGDVQNFENSSCTISQNSSSLTGAGCIDSSGTRGSYSISGSPDTMLNVTSSSITESNYTFSPTVPSSVTTDSSGAASFFVGGTLTVGSGATDGAKTIAYSINVNYP